MQGVQKKHKNTSSSILSEHFELSAHPIVTLFFFFNIKTLDVGLLPCSTELKQDKL
jgi:hypothetical protein